MTEIEGIDIDRLAAALVQSPLLRDIVQKTVAGAVEQSPHVRFAPGTFEGTDQNGDGLVRLDQQVDDDVTVTHCTVIGPHPNIGARVVVAFVPPMGAYLMGETVILRPDSELEPRVLFDQPSGEVSAIDANGVVVGKISPTLWYTGIPDGQRVQLDPFGGLRVFDSQDHLVVLVDAQGVQVRDPDLGIIHAALGHDGVRLASHSGNTVEIIPDQPSSVAPPKWAGSFTTLPLTNFPSPALKAYTIDDFELRHVIGFTNGVLGAESMTPPAGYTEQLDVENATSGSHMLVGSAWRRPQASNGLKNFATTDSAWQYANGHTVIVRSDGVTPPSIRDMSQAFQIFNTAQFTMALGPPATVAVGDLMIAFVSMGNDGGSIPSSWSVPTGWIFMGAGFQTSGSGISTSTLASGCWYKIATADDVALAGAAGVYNVDISVVGLATSTKKMHAAVYAIQDVALLEGGADIRFDPASRCRVYTNSDTTLSVGNVVTVNWDAVSFDPGTNFDLTTNAYTVPVTGPYTVGWRLLTSSLVAAGERFTALLIADDDDANPISVGSDITAPAAGRLTLTGADNLDLIAGQVLKVKVRQVNGSTRTINGSAASGPGSLFFHVQRTLST